MDKLGKIEQLYDKIGLYKATVTNIGISYHDDDETIENLLIYSFVNYGVIDAIESMLNLHFDNLEYSIITNILYRDIIATKGEIIIDKIRTLTASYKSLIMDKLTEIVLEDNLPDLSDIPSFESFRWDFLDQLHEYIDNMMMK
ncbi:MAG: hypothetical protein LBM02_09780 [Lachnospiraceae bacterium]|jgi:hypothetical protein|nr:hypothetical protein [Lachnospiraceae bacterium]